jgi:hypothetical protein
VGYVARILMASDGPQTKAEVRQMQSTTPTWDIRNEGRAWGKGEAWERYILKPEKIELVRGKLLSRDEDRELLLGLLLENVGADRAVQLGDSEVWRSAVAKLPHKS